MIEEHSGELIDRLREIGEKVRAQLVIDELTYHSYAYNRDISPEVSPERWAKIFQNTDAMEARYQDERKNPELKGRKKFPPAHFGQRAK